MSDEILYTQIKKQFNLFVNPPTIPNYIINNLNHEIRPYQEEALQHFIFVQDSDNADMSFNHLLFHMATGAGKTLVLAKNDTVFI
ncbi:DEAD/DEAH box helicase family protein [Peribacillus frigoritolerans]|uniref:DEAD/DEAH box helicase family protein n=1 Tax=Peribacillus frigoritolerans TaxID=450367 RepID=UPI0033159778